MHECSVLSFGIHVYSRVLWHVSPVIPSVRTEQAATSAGGYSELFKQYEPDNLKPIPSYHGHLITNY